jgi:hypothetical protein
MAEKSRDALAAVERELAGLERRRAELDHAIGRLRRVAAWLRRRSAVEAPSLTDGCRAVLRMTYPGGVTTREAKRLLALAGLDWNRYSNAMAAIHTVMKRLVQQQEAVVATGKDGRARYSLPRRVAIAVSPADVRDREFLRELLAAPTPEALADLVAARRR